jgi:hypothetical protein
MSLRYAHLVPDRRREAVVKLNEKPLHSLAMQLQWGGALPASSYSIGAVALRAGVEPDVGRGSS